MNRGDEVRFSDWIREHVTGGYGQCAEVTERMANAFPELRRVRGFFHDVRWGARTHWWLVTDGGEIVDPTGGQFPTGSWFPSGCYHEEIAEDDLASRVPVGRCLNCGQPVYREDGYSLDTCSSACYDAFARSLM